MRVVRNHPIVVASAVVAALLAAIAHALIIGADAESKAADMEKRGSFKDAAIYRLAGARGYEELIIPWEKENARSYSQFGKTELAETCTKRAEVEYPKKAKDNRSRYEEDLKKAGGEKLRKEVEQKVVLLLAEAAPIPQAIPTRLRSVETKEKAGEWLTAADLREVSARVYRLISVPFFDKEAGRAADATVRKRFQDEALRCLKLSRDNYGLAAQDYTRAADLYKGKTDAESKRLYSLCQKKASEMTSEQKVVASAVTARESKH